MSRGRGSSASRATRPSPPTSWAVVELARRRPLPPAPPRRAERVGLRARPLPAAPRPRPPGPAPRPRRRRRAGTSPATLAVERFLDRSRSARKPARVQARPRRPPAATSMAAYEVLPAARARRPRRATCSSTGAPTATSPPRSPTGVRLAVDSRDRPGRRARDAPRRHSAVARAHQLVRLELPAARRARVGLRADRGPRDLPADWTSRSPRSIASERRIYFNPLARPDRGGEPLRDGPRDPPRRAATRGAARGPRPVPVQRRLRLRDQRLAARAAASATRRASALLYDPG